MRNKVVRLLGVKLEMSFDDHPDNYGWWVDSVVFGPLRVPFVFVLLGAALSAGALYIIARRCL
jgi:hypothetical protein